MALAALFGLANPRLAPRVSKVDKQDELDNHEEERPNKADPAPRWA
jgi:hypothetical protein